MLLRFSFVKLGRCRASLRAFVNEKHANRSTCGRGRIINVTTPTSAIPIYGPSKAALEALSAIMAKDLDGTGVTVNVLDGVTDTPMISDEAGFDRAKMIQPEVMAPPLFRVKQLEQLCFARPSLHRPRSCNRSGRHHTYGPVNGENEEPGTLSLGGCSVNVSGENDRNDYMSRVVAAKGGANELYISESCSVAWPPSGSASGSPLEHTRLRRRVCGSTFSPPAGSPSTSRGCKPEPPGKSRFRSPSS
jgi:hypothetical protein